jgi:hypothetical protein
MITRDSILSTTDLNREPVPVPEWGGDVFVRTMTGRERDAFEASCNGGADMDNIRARLLVRCLCDEHGNRLFTDGDTEALGNTPAAPLVRLFAVAQRINKLSKQDFDELSKN